jgi:hypothetical protein
MNLCGSTSSQSPHALFARQRSGLGHSFRQHARTKISGRNTKQGLSRDDSIDPRINTD